MQNCLLNNIGSEEPQRLLMAVIKCDGDPFVVGGRENMDAILVYVPHEPSPVTTFITTTLARLNSVNP
jgi:hypothetical protein